MFYIVNFPGIWHFNRGIGSGIFAAGELILCNFRLGTDRTFIYKKARDVYIFPNRLVLHPSGRLYELIPWAREEQAISDES